MAPIMMTRESVQRALTYAVGLRGEDYVYPGAVGSGTNTCFYLDPEKGCPDCIVGMVLAFHGVDLAKAEEHANAMTVISRLVKLGVLSFESLAEEEIIENALRVGQLRQDGGETWGAARDAILAYFEEHPKAEVPA